MGTSMISKSTGERTRGDTETDPTGKARREPRGLLGDECGRAQRQEQRARRRPPASASRRAGSRRAAAGSAGSPRTRRGVRSSSRRRTRASHASAACARNSSIVSVASRPCVADSCGTTPSRRRTASVTVSSACLRSRSACRSADWAVARAALGEEPLVPFRSAGNERGSPIITSKSTTPFGAGDERTEGVALVERDVRALAADDVAARHVALEHEHRRGCCCGRGAARSSPGPTSRRARGTRARSRATSPAPTSCGRPAADPPHLLVLESRRDGVKRGLWPSASPDRSTRASVPTAIPAYAAPHE